MPAIRQKVVIGAVPLMVIYNASMQWVADVCSLFVCCCLLLLYNGCCFVLFSQGESTFLAQVDRSMKLRYEVFVYTEYYMILSENA